MDRDGKNRHRNEPGNGPGNEQKDGRETGRKKGRMKELGAALSMELREHRSSFIVYFTLRILVIATLVLPPLVEETIFRGLIMQYLRRGGASFIVANLIQAVLFGFFHMNIVQGIYTAIFGFLLGYLA